MLYFDRTFLSVVFLFFAGLLFASGSFAKGVEGLWMDESGAAKMKVAPCGKGTICAKIVWLRHPNDASGRPLVDDNNGDARLRRRPILGLPVAYDMRPSGRNKWQGIVYDPKRGGQSYTGYLTLLRDGRMKVTGCLGIFCESEYWSPAQE